MTLKLLVTGGMGFVGSAVVQQALENRFVVRASTREKLAESDTSRPYLLTSDLSHSTDWMPALHGVDAVVHCAARVHVMHDTAVDSLRAFRAVNVEGTLALARQAANSGVKRFVFVSSIKVNGEHTTPGLAFTESDAVNPQDAYARSKYEAELGLRQLSANTGMEVVIIRPPLVYGPGVKANFASLARAVRHGWPLPLGALQNQRSLVGLSNLVDFIFTCISHPDAAYQTFLVSDGQDLSTTELLHAMAKAARVPTRLLPIPGYVLQAGAFLLGKGDKLRRLCSNLQVDISKARNLLGWVPPVSVEEELRRTMAR